MSGHCTINESGKPRHMLEAARDYCPGPGSHPHLKGSQGSMTAKVSVLALMLLWGSELRHLVCVCMCEERGGGGGGGNVRQDSHAYMHARSWAFALISF